MTCIVWHKRKLYADSVFTNNGEKFTSLSKITQYAQNYRIFSEKHQIDDKLLGFFSVASQTAAKGIVSKLITLYDGSIDLCLAALEAANAMNLITRENHCEVLMVGNKHIYSLVVGLGSSNSVYIHKYDLDGTFHLGSGGNDAAGFMMKDGVDPLRAMHAAIYKDEYSGGLIEVWQHFESNSPEEDCEFFRTMIDDPTVVDLEYAPSHLTEKRRPTFVHEQLGMARFALDIGVREGSDLELLKQVMAEVNAQRDAVATAEAEAKEKAFDKLYKRFCANKFNGLTEEQLQACRERYVKEHNVPKHLPLVCLSAPTGPALPEVWTMPSLTKSGKVARKKPAARVTPKRSTTARKGVKK